MIRNLFFSVIATLLIIGCFETSHNFKIRFNDIQGLKDSDLVYFDETAIGEVTDVEYTDTGNYLVSVAIENQFSSLPKDSSTFYIDSNPETEDQKAIRIIQIEQGGKPVEEDEIVKGQSKYVSVFDQFTERLRKGAQALESDLKEFIEELQNLSESEQIKQIEKQLDKILAEIGNLSLEMKHKLETEILPRIKEQLEDLRRRLEKDGEKEKLRQIDRKLETISTRIKV